MTTTLTNRFEFDGRYYHATKQADAKIAKLKKDWRDYRDGVDLFTIHEAIDELIACKAIKRTGKAPNFLTPWLPVQ
jgi:hypothetical protein